jgi:hypothetical protein
MVKPKNIIFYSVSISFFILIAIGIIVPAVIVVDLQKKKDATSVVSEYQKLQRQYILNMFFLILSCVGLIVLLFLIAKYRCGDFKYNPADFDLLTTGRKQITTKGPGGNVHSTEEIKNYCLINPSLLTTN